jgi:transcriptional regulator with XRE-family HTH domain
MAPKRGITYSGTPFTRQLAAWMALAGLDDVELGRKVGVSKVTIGRWRSGINTPTTEKWPALARALNVTEEEIGRLPWRRCLGGPSPHSATVAKRTAFHCRPARCGAGHRLRSGFERSVGVGPGRQAPGPAGGQMTKRTTKCAFSIDESSVIWYDVINGAG